VSIYVFFGCHSERSEESPHRANLPRGLKVFSISQPGAHPRAVPFSFAGNLTRSLIGLEFLCIVQSLPFPHMFTK